jgi:hypothetical protein
MAPKDLMLPTANPRMHLGIACQTVGLRLDQGELAASGSVNVLGIALISTVELRPMERAVLARPMAMSSSELP